MIKICLPMQEIQILSLGQEDPLKKEMATHSSYSYLGNPMDRRAWQATVHRVSQNQTRLKGLQFSRSVMSDCL